jgi:hypothetical protein
MLMYQKMVRTVGIQYNTIQIPIFRFRIKNIGLNFWLWTAAQTWKSVVLARPT